jgi:hypothetical protein
MSIVFICLFAVGGRNWQVMKLGDKFALNLYPIFQFLGLIKFKYCAGREKNFTVRDWKYCCI